MKFKLSTLAVVVATTALPLAASASGLSRTSQSTGIFFEKGRVVEINMRHVMPDLPGNYTAAAQNMGAASGQKNNASPNSDAPEAYTTAGWGLKADLNDFLSFALIYDQPWGVDYSYTQGYYTGWGVNVDAHNLTALLGGEVAPGFKIFAGPAVENNTADISVAVRSPGQLPSPPFPANTPMMGELKYNTSFGDTSWGYVIGGAYEIPAIALRVALTYRSEIEHEQDADETFQNTAYAYTLGQVLPQPQQSSKRTFKYKSPKSVNLDFQTGITQSTLLLASVRWTDHSEFVVNPATWNDIMRSKGTYNPLASYEKASIEYSLGVGQKITDMFSIAAGISADMGTGGDSNDASPFGPTASTLTFTLGGVATLSEQLQLTLGAGYTQIKGGGTMIGSTPTATFDDGSAIAVGGKVSIRF